MHRDSSQNNKELILTEYQKLIEGIEYFHGEQTEHRFIASKLLLGTFAIIGTLFYTKIDEIHLPVLLLSALAPLLTILLITINFSLDLVVKERLRLCCFLEAIKYEKKHSWLPPFHLLMIDSSEEKYYRAGYKKGSYYIGCVMILMIVSAISFAIIPEFSSTFSRSIILFLLIIGFLFYRKFINKYSRHTDLLKEIHDAK